MINFSRFLATVFAIALLFIQYASADITLCKLYSDHMVLQQNASVRIWGTSDANDELVIKFADQEIKVVAGANGNWESQIRTGEHGGPYELSVVSSKTGARVLLSNVMVGEVWICSGQSNMEWPVEKSLNPDIEIEDATNFPNIRLFRVHHHAVTAPLSDFDKVDPWICCAPESVASFSAVAYQFAKRVSKDVDIPIGLIQTTWGGTRCEAWISYDAMQAEPELTPLLEHWKENDNPTSQQRPSNLYNGMVSPLRGFAFRGVLWYQGESNVGRGKQYATLFPLLIRDWREKLGPAEFPFYFVQLAPFRYGNMRPEALPEVWDAQLKTFKTVPCTGMAITTDIGNIRNIHPKNKQEVGRRLALWALAGPYCDLVQQPPAEVTGPIYDSQEVVDNAIHIHFTHIGEGLEMRGGTELTHFTICGEDQVFHPAKAVIEGDKVVVTSDQVDRPVAVRFGWTDTAQPNLFNSHGLPASPFRTDDFPLLSEGVHY